MLCISGRLQELSRAVNHWVDYCRCLFTISVAIDGISDVDGIV
jgi:hypothetical protein